MEIDVLKLILIAAGIAMAVMIAIVAGALSARLFFDASGLDPTDGTGKER